MEVIYPRCAGLDEDVQRPTRGTRGRMLLRLLLPTGSEPGPYEVEIRDPGAVSRASARGNADIRNKVTTIDLSLSTGSLSPGAYQLAVRHACDQWQQFPLSIE